MDARVLVVEARNNVAGNAYDEVDETGVRVHRYGAHIFHTGSRAVWSYLSQFTDWFPYEHRVPGEVDGRLLPLPVNLATIEALLPREHAGRVVQRLLAAYGTGARVPVLKLRASSDAALRDLADTIYEKAFLHYTTKQWGLAPEQLDPSVTARVPVVLTRDDRYFRDTYRGIPAEGYTRMFERMLDHPNITVVTGADGRAAIEAERPRRALYTGAVDAYFDYRHGPLPYRSLRFQNQTLPVAQQQPVAVVNQPDRRPYTRIIEHTHFAAHRRTATTLSFEYPQPHEPGRTEPFYPVPRPENRDRYRAYAEEAAAVADRVLFAGRLADYRYYDMHQAVGRALVIARAVAEGAPLPAAA